MVQLDRMILDEGSILSAFEAVATRFPDRAALVFLGTAYSYSDLRALIAHFAAGAGDLGVRRSDRVLIYLPNCPQWLVSYLGLQSLGATPVPVSHIYTPHELRYLIEHSEAETVICADTNFGYVKQVAADTGVKRIFYTHLTELLPWWKTAFGKLFDKLPRSSVSREPDVHPFRSVLRRSQSHSHTSNREALADVAHLLYTGGTTGFPKGVPHTHQELLSGIAGVREVYREFIGTEHHTLILPLPLFHMFSQDMLFATGLHLGNTVVIAPKPNTDAVLAAIQENRGSLLAGVPTLYRQMLENDRLDAYDLSSLRYCWSAGDLLPSEVAQRWRERFGVPIHQVYGSTETVCISVGRLDEAPCERSVGRLIPTREALVIDPDTGDAIPNNSPGELLIGSAYSYPLGGYWHNADETRHSFVKRDGQLWCRTGDYVKLSSAGEIEFVDRRADLIKHKGFRISASRVESVLQDHPAVIAAGVVGTPDRQAGENVKAFVILKEDARGVTSYDLMRHCRERLLPYEVPDYIEFRDMLPKSKVGKLLRRELKDEEIRRAGG
jgi:long-chain acyl-CoA synthetase